MTGNSGYIPYTWMDGKKKDSDPHTSKKTKKFIPFLFQLLCSCHYVFFTVHHMDVPVVPVLLFCAGTKDG